LFVLFVGFTGPHSKCVKGKIGLWVHLTSEIYAFRRMGFMNGIMFKCFLLTSK